MPASSFCRLGFLIMDGLRDARAGRLQDQFWSSVKMRPVSQSTQQTGTQAARQPGSQRQRELERKFSSIAA